MDHGHLLMLTATARCAAESQRMTASLTVETVASMTHQTQLCRQGDLPHREWAARPATMLGLNRRRQR